MQLRRRRRDLRTKHARCVNANGNDAWREGVPYFGGHCSRCGWINRDVHALRHARCVRDTSRLPHHRRGCPRLVGGFDARAHESATHGAAKASTASTASTARQTQEETASFFRLHGTDIAPVAAAKSASRFSLSVTARRTTLRVSFCFRVGIGAAKVVVLVLTSDSPFT